MKEKRELLIVSSGRSGTSYTAKVFQKSGYDLGHEKMGDFGTCSMYCVPTRADCEYKPNTPNRKDYNFKSIFYQIRNPLRTIESIGNCFTFKVRHWTHDVLGVPLPGRAGKRICPLNDKLKWAMQYWLEVDDRCREFAQPFRVETDLDNLAELLDVSLDISKVKENYNQGLRFAFKSKKQCEEIKQQIGTTTYKDLENVDKDLTLQVVERAESYGYKINR